MILTLRFLIGSLLISTLFACSTKPIHAPLVIKSPLGIYKSNSQQKYWLAIMENEQYFLCSSKECYQGKYQRVPANYGVILVGFFATEIGQRIEYLSHKDNNTEVFYQAMKKLRLSEPRANDLAFHVSSCDGVPCVGLGHRRSGIKFYKIEDFDAFWKVSK